MTLVDEAKLADKIADALTQFRNAVPDHKQDINATLTALTGLSWALGEVDRILDNDARLLDLIEPDLRLVHTAISFTLGDIWHIMGNIGHGSHVLFDDDFQRTWKDIGLYCSRMGKTSLSVRVDNYRRFLLALCHILKRQTPVAQEYRELQSYIKSLSSPYSAGLLTDQTPRPNDRQLKPSKKLSYERQRPLSPTDSNDSRRFSRHLPLNVPSPPVSPTTTFSSVSQLSGVEQELSEHWAKAVFKDLSSTSLPPTHEPSRHHDGAGHPLSDNPDESYEEVIALKFPSDFRASLHCRREHHMRAKMTLDFVTSRGRMVSTSLSLHRLFLRRSGSMLRFAHLSRDGRTHVLWASLQFNTIERLILFALTFVAMRTAGGAPPESPTRLWEDQYRDEVEVYRGGIHDGKHRLDLCIYRDRPSGAIRLQTTKRTGTKAGTPLWTAFVTHQITSPMWCERVERKVVFLHELRLRTFKFNYEAERAQSGAFILAFESTSDTDLFMEIVADLRRNMQEGAWR